MSTVALERPDTDRRLLLVPVPDGPRPPVPRQAPLAPSRPRGEPVTPNRVARPAATGARRLRLTRPGRLTLTLLGLAAAVGVVGLADASAGRAQQQPSLHGVVVVQPGDTLWGVAVRSDPQADPRVTVARIARLNGLSDGTIRLGQQLQLPRR